MPCACIFSVEIIYFLFLETYIIKQIKRPCLCYCVGRMDNSYSKTISSVF